MRRISVALAALLVAGACAGSSDGTSTTGTSTTATTAAGGTTGEYTSPDGRLSLQVDGSVPGGVTIDEIGPSSLDFGDDVVTLGAYDLGPSGTVFDRPAAMTFDTGETYDPEHPAPLVGVLISDDGQTWEALSPVGISVVDGSVVVTADVPHFSRLVIERSDYGMYLDPEDVDTWVGDTWSAYFDLYDRKFVPVTNSPVRYSRLYRDGYDTIEGVFGPDEKGFVQTLRDDLTYSPDTVSSGAVDPVEGNDWIDTYDYLPRTGFGGGLGDSMPFVEAIYGYHDFECAAAGTGSYGVSLDVMVHRGDLVFGARFATGQLALVRPADGVVLRYLIEAPAWCRESYGRVAAFLSVFVALHHPVIEGLIGKVSVDSLHDLIYSISTVAAGIYSPRVDLRASLGMRLRMSRPVVDALFNESVFECGAMAEVPRLGEVTTVCPPGVSDVPEGDLVVIAAQYADTVPTVGDTSHYTYAAVFDSNGDPADDWQFQGQYDWDFFIGTDRWYQINWDPDAQAWSMTVTNGQQPGGATSARAVLAGDTIFWVIPASEFPSADPTYRVTSFVHDGTYRPEFSAGDVGGADPTEPLLPIEAVED